jgi:diacylglycerol kinase family enzyme
VPHLRSVAVFPARTMTVAGPPGDPVQADGDIVAYLPVTLAVAEKTLRIIVGRDG